MRSNLGEGSQSANFRASGSRPDGPRTPASAPTRSFSPPGASVPIQTQTPLAHPRPSRPDSTSQFSPLLREYGFPPRSPRRITEDNDPSPPVYVRYQASDSPFSLLAPEAATTSPFQVYGQAFWSVSHALAWAKAFRFMHSQEGTHDERIVARARQQEILYLSPSDDNFASETIRLYEETPTTPSWAAYEIACADVVTKAKITGNDARARELLLHHTGERAIYWDVNSNAWGRGRDKPDGQNAYGLILMTIRTALRQRPGSPLNNDTNNPLTDVLYGLR